MCNLIFRHQFQRSDAGFFLMLRIMFTELTPKQLAAAFGQKEGFVKVKIGMNKFVLNKNDLIDIVDPDNMVTILRIIKSGIKFDLNKALIEEHEEYAGRIEIAGIKTRSKKEQMVVIDIDDLSGKMKQIDYELKKATLQRTKKQTKLDEIRIQRQLGKLIPYQDVDKVFLYAVNSLNNLFMNELKSIADVYHHRFGMSHEEYIELLKELRERYNITITNMREMLVNGLEGIRDDQIDNPTRDVPKRSKLKSGGIRHDHQ